MSIRSVDHAREDSVRTYHGCYLRRASADRMMRVCHRRGWEPTLSRRFGVWIITVRV